MKIWESISKIAAMSKLFTCIKVNISIYGILFVLGLLSPDMVLQMFLFPSGTVLGFYQLISRL